MLTNRAREVVTLVAPGLSNEQIAERLAISPLTAKTHIPRAPAKLDARDRVQLVILAYETGLVRPSPPAISDIVRLRGVYVDWKAPRIAPTAVMPTIM